MHRNDDAGTPHRQQATHSRRRQAQAHCENKEQAFPRGWSTHTDFVVPVVVAHFSTTVDPEVRVDVIKRGAVVVVDHATVGIEIRNNEVVVNRGRGGDDRGCPVSHVCDVRDSIPVQGVAASKARTGITRKNVPLCQLESTGRAEKHKKHRKGAHNSNTLQTHQVLIAP